MLGKKKEKKIDLINLVRTSSLICRSIFFNTVHAHCPACLSCFPALTHLTQVATSDEFESGMLEPFEANVLFFTYIGHRDISIKLRVPHSRFK